MADRAGRRDVGEVGLIEQVGPVGGVVVRGQRHQVLIRHRARHEILIRAIVVGDEV